MGTAGVIFRFAVRNSNLLALTVEGKYAFKISKKGNQQMNTKSSFRKIILGVIVSVASLGLTFAASNTSFSGDRVTVSSDKSFEDVSSAGKSLVAKNGMMVMAEVDQGKMLSMTGLSLKATLFIVGNPTVGKQLFEQDHGVGLYVPLRVFVFADASGKTFVSYDRPSAILAQFKNEKIGMVAQMLDQKLDGLANMAAH
jgi:uncharacterized protein (DUF302 family)